MKNYCLPWMAVATSVTFTAYNLPSPKHSPHKEPSNITLIYVEGPQSLRTSYFQIEGFSSCNGSAKLCAIQVTDEDGDAEISPSEFSRQFRMMDTNSNLSLDDESTSLLLQKKN
ncbi:hypothetical protein HHL16_09065 [Pseudoflavitalea sp. G-6-1-2]|uniref:hypothetical protein n=1 Tax=Pseudoflavitalea sp. G-6-1-2 TaxID=2728841 RepID=UPI00146DB7E9|nr:hypothetical protein [Pseudoflavitalea sp. G-6-1-2]NML21021.1 hypothetical protein [Pseudoflavitalea sp. G-6-1-2]